MAVQLGQILHAAPYLCEEERITCAQAYELARTFAAPDESEQSERTAAIFERLTGWHVSVHTLLAALIFPLIRRRMVAREQLLSVVGGVAVERAERIVGVLERDGGGRDGGGRDGGGRDGGGRDGGGSEGQSEAASLRETKAELLRHLFALTYCDVEAALLYVAMHIAARPYSVEPEAARAWAEDTQQIVQPLLVLLGMWRERNQLGNAIVECLAPAQVKQYSRYAVDYLDRHGRKYDLIADRLRCAFADHSIDIHGMTNLHVLTSFSLHRRLQEARKTNRPQVAENVLQLMRVDVHVATELQCYQALGIVHRLWRPVGRQTTSGSRLFDYISAPRYNGYRCLVATVMDEPGQDELRKGEPRRRLIEFRITDDEMADVNAGGVTAWLRRPELYEIRNAWWTNDALRRTISATEVGSSTPQVYVFSPLGEVHLLPDGSTPVDYAFKVHAQVGTTARAFLVNGRAVAFDYRLRNGDLVEVELDERFPALTADWATSARTGTAQAHIRRSLAQRQHSSHEGRDLIDRILTRELELHKLRLSPEQIESSMVKVSHVFGCPDLPSLYVKVLDPQSKPSLDQVAFAVIEDQLVGQIVLANGRRWHDIVRIPQCWMSSQKTAARLSAADRVIPGEPIVGVIKRTKYHETLLVHRAGCEKIPAGAEEIPIKWRAIATEGEAVEITISAMDRKRLLRDVLEAAYALYGESGASGDGLYMHRVHAEVDGDAVATISLVISACTTEEILPLEAKLKELQQLGVIHAFKTWHYLPGQKSLLLARNGRRMPMPYAPHAVTSGHMFFGRRVELERTISHLREGSPLTVIYGHKRIGKTSFLLHLRDYALEGESTLLPVYLDLLSVNPFTPAEILMNVARLAAERLTQAEKLRPERASRLNVRTKDWEHAPFVAFEQWMHEARPVLGKRKVVVMIDEFTRVQEAWETGRLDDDFFGSWRSLAARLSDVQFLLGIHESVYAPLAREGRSKSSWILLQDALPVQLDRLDEDAAKRLIRQPVGHVLTYHDEVVEQLLALTACHPYYVHILCSEITGAMAEKDQREVTLDDLRAVREDVARWDAAYFNHFFDDLPETHQQVLNTLAQSSREPAWLSVAQVHESLRPRLATRSITLAELEGMLDELCQKRILEQAESDEGVVFRIPVGLFHLWLRKHPLPRPRVLRTVREPVSGEGAANE